MAEFEVRQFQSMDMQMLYRICLLTGKDGSDASGTLDDDILGHYYAGPYATFEPDLCFVLADNGAPSGYILGTSNSSAFAVTCEQRWWPRLRQLYPLPETDDMSPTAMMTRAIHRGYQAPSICAEYPAHLHIDILPVAQSRGFGHKMMEMFCNALRTRGVPAVHFGVSRINERAVGFYRHVGFQVIQESETIFTFGRKLI